MHHSLTFIRQIEQSNTEIPAIFFDGRHHLFRQAVSKRAKLHVGRNDVIDRGQSPFGIFDRQSTIAQDSERLRAGHFMDQMQSDEQLRLAAGQ